MTNGPTPQPVTAPAIASPLVQNPITQALLGQQVAAPQAQAAPAPPPPNAAGQQAQSAIQQNALQAGANYAQAAATPPPAQAPQQSSVNATQTQTMGAPTSTQAPPSTGGDLSAAPTLEQQVAADVANPLGTYGSQNNGFGQYAANLIPALTLNPQLQAQLQGIMANSGLQAQINALPQNSPYKATLEQELYAGSGQNATGYNGAGIPYQVLNYGGAYNQVEAAATATGKVVPPDLAAALQAMDAYAGTHDSLQYGVSTAGSEGTSFGSGDNTDPTAGGSASPSPTGTINPTPESLLPGGLFGDSIDQGGASAFPDYQGGNQPNVVNTGAPYQPGVTGVTPGSATITGPPAPEPGIEAPTLPTNAANGTLGVPSTGNPAGDTAPYSPEVAAAVSGLLSAPMGDPVTMDQTPNANTTNISNPTNDVFTPGSLGTPVTGSPTNDVFGNDNNTKMVNQAAPYGLADYSKMSDMSPQIEAAMTPTSSTTPTGGWGNSGGNSVGGDLSATAGNPNASDFRLASTSNDPYTSSPTDSDYWQQLARLLNRKR